MKLRNISLHFLAICLVLSLSACAGEKIKIKVPAMASSTNADESNTTEEEPNSFETETDDTEELTAASEEEPETSVEPTETSAEETAAAEPDPYLAAQLIGTWDLKMDLSELMMEQISKSIGSDMSQYADDVEMDFYLTFEFYEDNRCKFYLDEALLSASMDKCIDSLCPVMAEITYDMLEEQDISREEAYELFLTQYGTGPEEYYRGILEEGLDLEKMFDSMRTLETTYRLAGKELFLADEDGKFDNNGAELAIEGDMMTLDGMLDESLDETLASMGLALPWVLYRR